LAENNKSNLVNQEQALDIEQVKRRLDMLDQRLDNIDSMVTAVAERVMNQPITLNITCPYCGKNIEITIIGSEKPRA
jgi:tetrahydromethanopterin S-methyltransferase subunit G